MNRRAQPWLGTLVDISILDALPDNLLQAAFQAAFGVVRDVHECMSFHSDASDIARFNRAAVGAKIKLSPHTFGVLNFAQELNQVTAGIFDVRIASRLAACEFLPHSASTPLPEYQSGQQAYELLNDGQIKNYATTG